MRESDPEGFLAGVGLDCFDNPTEYTEPSLLPGLDRWSTRLFRINK
jgi:hypothetical protein